MQYRAAFGEEAEASMVNVEEMEAELASLDADDEEAEAEGGDDDGVEAGNDGDDEKAYDDGSEKEPADPPADDDGTDVDDDDEVSSDGGSEESDAATEVAAARAEREGRRDNALIAAVEARSAAVPAEGSVNAQGRSQRERKAVNYAEYAQAQSWIANY